MSIVGDHQTGSAADLTDAALTTLQLERQPFGANPVNGDGVEITFLDEIAHAQLDDIKQALISGDDLLLILGPEGCGKTTLLNQLAANSSQRIQCFSVRGSEKFKTTNLFAGMLEAFKRQPPDDLQQMLDELMPALQGMTDSNTLGAVVLDNAHQIPEEQLTALLSSMLYLNSVDETLLRVTLAGPTEFEERIPELLPQGADLPYSSLAIDAFDKDRSAAYLDFRLQNAGLTGDFPFSDTEIAAINQEAGGRPGLLHDVAARHLNSRDEGYSPDLPPELSGSKAAGAKAAGGGILAKLGNMKLLVGAAALLMILAGLFWLKPSGNNVPDDRYTVVESKKIESSTGSSSDSETEANAAKLRALAEQKQADAQALADSQSTDAAGSSETSTAAGGDALVGDGSSAASGDAAAADKAAAQLLAKQESDAARAADAKKLADEKAAADQAAKDLLAKEKAAKDEAAATLAAKQKAAADLAAKEKADADAAAKKAAAEAASNLTNLESPNWILVQNPALFTVQMSASTDRKSVESFLARNELEAPNSIFSFQRNGATWFALVHGLYNSIEDARKDVEKMPESARSNQPWIRAVGRIQKAVKEP